MAFVVTSTIRGTSGGQLGGHALQECASATAVSSPACLLLTCAPVSSTSGKKPHLLNDIDWNHRVKFRSCDVEFSKHSWYWCEKQSFQDTGLAPMINVTVFVSTFLQPSAQQAELAINQHVKKLDCQLNQFQSYINGNSYAAKWI